MFKIVADHDNVKDDSKSQICVRSGFFPEGIERQRLQNATRAAPARPLIIFVDLIFFLEHK